MSDPDDSLLMAYADGERDPVAAGRVEAALERDPELQRKVERLRRSAHLVRAAFSHSPCQSALSRRNVAMGRTAPRPRYALLAACVALFMAGAVTGSAVTLFRPSVSFADRLLDEVADYHALYARETEHQAEVPAARLEHIEEWLGERLHRRLVVPKLSEHGLTFAGARLLVVDGAPVAQLLYHRPGHEHEPLGL